MEHYKVTFLVMQPEGYWIANSKIYESEGKDDHEKVEKKCIEDHKGKKIQIKSVRFQ